MHHALGVQVSDGLKALDDELKDHALVTCEELDKKLIGQDSVHELL